MVRFYSESSTEKKTLRGNSPRLVFAKSTANKEGDSEPALGKAECNFSGRPETKLQMKNRIKKNMEKTCSKNSFPKYLT